MADGTIRFDTKIDDSGFKKDANSLKAQGNKLVESMKKSNKGKGFSVIDADQVRSDMKAVESVIEETKSKIQDISTEIEIGEKNVISLENKLGRLQYRKAMGEDLGANQNTQSWKKMLYEIDLTRKAIHDENIDLNANKNSLAQAQGQLSTYQMQQSALHQQLSAYYNEAAQYVPLGSRIKNALSSAFGFVGEKVKSMNDKTKSALDSMKERLKQFISKMREAKPPTDNLTKGIFKLSNMFKLMALRMIIRAAINSMKQGFQNLVAYSSPVAQSAQMIKNSLQQLNNSLSTAFAPILTTVAPILQTLINYLSAAATAIAHFFAALTGKSTVVQATKVQKGYSKALGGTSKAADKAQKSVAGFDTVMQLQSKDSAGGAGGGGAGGADVGGMFEEVPVNPKIKEMLDNIMDVLQPTIDAFKRLGDALEPVKKFAAQGAIDFYNKFLKPVGKWVFGEGLPRMIDAVSNGIGKIDWGKINTALANFWDALAPFAINVGKGLVWLWEHFLVPVATWVMNDAVPAFLDVLTAGLDAANSIIEVAKPYLKWIWDNWLVPIAKWTGGKIIDILHGITTALEFVAETCTKIAKGETWVNIGKFILEGLWNGLKSLTQWLWNNVKEIWNGIIAGFKQLFGISSPSTLFEGFGKNIIQGLINGISALFTNVKTCFNKIIDFLKTTFTKGWQGAWDGVKNIFKNVFNGIVGFLEKAINFMISGLNKLSFEVPDWIPGLGGKTFGFNISKVSLPRLATGTVIPRNAGAFAAVLGDNTREAEVVSPLSTMKQALAEALMESGYGQRDIYITLQLDNREFAKAVYKSNQSEQQRVGVRLAGVY